MKKNAFKTLFSQELEVFLHFSQSKSISKTAAHFSLSISSVIRNIRSLEGFLHVDLLAKSCRPLCLTKEGEEFAQKARKLSGEMNDLVLDLQRKEKHMKLIRMGFIESFVDISFYVLRELLSANKTAVCLTGTSDRLRHLMENEEVDLVLTSETLPNSHFPFDEKILAEPLVFVLPAELELKDGVDWESLKFSGLPFIRSYQQSETGINIETLDTTKGLKLVSQIETDFVGTKLRLIAAGKGWSCVPVMSLYQNRLFIESSEGKYLRFAEVIKNPLSRMTHLIGSDSMDRSSFIDVSQLVKNSLRNEALPWVSKYCPFAVPKFLIE